MSEARAYVTLKRAARQLGVHEQTLRSWEKRGLIRLVRLPGSGYRRVPVEEIDRLRRGMEAVHHRAGVQLVPPRPDAESAAQARALADRVAAELAGLESATTLDEMMSSSRGRTWSP